MSTDVKAHKEPTWKELPVGGLITEAGSAEKYITGGWRAERPVWDSEKCIHCLICYIYCPDSAIMVTEDSKIAGVDYDHCKGCGICAQECPPKVKAYTMVSETEFHGK
ncbi:MAG TPA: 4Fe-4S binding protein [Armatimonadota bacterium]|jgi:pyruvate ferredoxin oxidoreductase delta subunit